MNLGGRRQVNIAGGQGRMTDAGESTIERERSVPASAMTRQESTRQRVPLLPIPAEQWTANENNTVQNISCDAGCLVLFLHNSKDCSKNIVISH